MQTMTTERTRQIQAIIAQRFPLREKIAAVEENLRALSRSLETLTQNRDNPSGTLRDRLISQVPDLAYFSR
jgi:hypothetical protein